MSAGSAPDVKRRLSSCGPCLTFDREYLQRQEEHKHHLPLPLLETELEGESQLMSPTSPGGAGLHPTSETDSHPGEDSEDVDSDEREQGMEDVWKEIAIKCGYLMKKGERRHSWKKRYFVLRPKRFGYYKDEREYKLLRDIPLTDIRTCARVQVKKHENVFGIVTANRTYYVKAQDQADMNDWLVKIEQVAKAAKRVQDEEGSVSLPEDDAATPHALDSLSRATTATRPIPMAGPSQQRPVAQPQSYISTTTMSSSNTTPFSPGSEVVSSSLTSDDTFSDVSPPFASTSTSTSKHSALPPITLTHSGPYLGDVPSQAISPTSLVASPVTMLESEARPSPVRRLTSFSGGLVQSSSDEEDDDFEVVPRSQPVQIQSPHSPLRTGGSGSPVEADRVIMSGYLTKQGKRKNWRKRWFMLTSTSLSYQRSHMDQKVHYSIPLNRILDVMEFEAPVRGKTQGAAERLGHLHHLSQSPESTLDSSRKAYEHCFQIITPQKTLKLCATDEESEIKWISAIRVMLQASRKSDLAPAPPMATSPSQRSAVEQSAASPQSKMPHRHSVTLIPAIQADHRQVNAANLPSIETKLREAEQGIPAQQRPRAATTHFGRITVDAIGKHFHHHEPQSHRPSQPV